MKPTIKEVIVVEGKDDVSAVLRAVDATIVITNGMGLTNERLKEIKSLADKQGIIVFTDPDVPGTMIRNRVSEVVPDAKHAFLTRQAARHPVTGRLGIEYAQPQDILEALHSAYATPQEPIERYSNSDLMAWGLTGTAAAKARRKRFCDLLHLGQANSKALLKRLNQFRIEPDVIADALAQLEDTNESQ